MVAPYGSGTQPFQPFYTPVPVPTAAPTTGDQFQVSMSGEWWALVAGACYALVADSTWQATSLSQLNQVRAWAYQVLRQIDSRSPVIDLQFRVNPSHPQNLDFSIDGGLSWNLTADTAVHFTPEFIADGAAPAGYDLSVNGGYTQLAIPLLTATDPDAVVTDPLSDLVNQIVPGADINALKLAVQGNATPLQLVNGGITLGNLLLLVAAL